MALGTFREPEKCLQRREDGRCNTRYGNGQLRVLRSLFLHAGKHTATDDRRQNDRRYTDPEVPSFQQSCGAKMRFLRTTYACLPTPQQIVEGHDGLLSSGEPPPSKIPTRVTKVTTVIRAGGG